MVLGAVLHSGQSIDEVTCKPASRGQQTALSIAVKTNQPTAVQFLCSWGAAIDLPKPFGKSMLAASSLFMAAQQPDNRIYMVLQQWATYEEMAAVCETDNTCAEVAAEVWQSPNQQVARRSLVDFCMLASVLQVSKYVRMVNVFYTAHSVDTKS